MLEEHLEWANASYYHSSEGTVNSSHFWQIVERIVEILLQFVENDGIIFVIKDCAWREEYMAA